MKRLITIIIILTYGNCLIACSCWGESSVKQAIKNSDAVITGTILSKETVVVIDSTIIKLFKDDTLSHDLFKVYTAKYRFEVESIYKGKFSTDTLTIYTGVGGGDCGNRFAIGGKYIIYGNKNTYFQFVGSPTKEKDVLWTNICTRTRAFNLKEIEAIEKIRKKKRIKWMRRLFSHE